MNVTNSKGFGHNNVQDELIMLDENLYPMHTPQKKIIKKMPNASGHGFKSSSKKSSSFNIQD